MTRRAPIVITGFMGCGKTEVARTLARRLDLALVDLDEMIAEQHGRTAAQLIVEEGESVFREIETTTLRELLENGDGGVISLGGGAWITDTNRELISQHHGISVWLDTPFEVCWQRIEASGDDRPLGRSRAQAEELYQRRQPVYKLASIHIQTLADDSVDTLVTRITAHLKN